MSILDDDHPESVTKPLSFGRLIRPDGLERGAAGSLEAKSAFVGWSDLDPLIPAGRVQYTAECLERIGGAVDFRIHLR